MYAIFPLEYTALKNFDIDVDAHPTENAVMINLNFQEEVDLQIDLHDGRAKNLMSLSEKRQSGSYRLELPNFDANSYTLKLADAAGRFYRSFRIMKAFC